MEEKEVLEKPWLKVGCCESCYYARELKCVCRCGGVYHGKGSMTKLDGFLQEEDPIRLEKNFRPSEI